MKTINNVRLFAASTIRLDKKNQNGILYLVDIAYQLKTVVMAHERNTEYQEKCYELCLNLVKHKEKIQSKRLEQENLIKKLAEINTNFPRWKTRKYKGVKDAKMYWKRLYENRLATEKRFLEFYYQELEKAFPKYLATFNELLERVRHVCVFE